MDSILITVPRERVARVCLSVDGIASRSTIVMESLSAEFMVLIGLIRQLVRCFGPGEKLNLLPREKERRLTQLHFLYV